MAKKAAVETTVLSKEILGTTEARVRTWLDKHRGIQTYVSIDAMNGKWDIHWEEATDAK